MSADVQPAPAGFEDLDRIAEQYAARLSRCAGPQAARLREEMVRAALPMAERLARRYRMAREPEDVSRLPAGRKVVLDLRRMPLLDASGIAVLLAVQEAARVRRITVTAVGLQPFVRRIALASGLGPLLTED